MEALSRELRNKDLVSSRRVGKEVYYKSANTEQSVLSVSYTHLFSFSTFSTNKMLRTAAAISMDPRER